MSVDHGALANAAPLTAQAALPVAAVDSLQVVWHGRFGSMEIEVRNGRAYVNGDPVEAAEAADGDGLVP
jgi:hypothetical protein